MRLRIFRAALVCAALLTAATAFAAPAKPTELNGIRQTVLPNGLTIVTKEVHAAPVVHFAVYYQVGSVNEEVGQTGMSHLMEHMMFKGTKSRGPGVISSTLQKIGSHFNATTYYDRTEYHETLAAEQLETAMQIESDRMVNSLYDEGEHQKEMTVVRSEYEAGENDPGRALSKAVRLTAYQVHPYRWQTIGFRSDIENFTRDEMYAYYKNYYTPNNATMVIVGDFDTQAAIAMAKKYFGGIASHPVTEHFITPEPPQEGERRVVLRRAGTTPLVQIAYHIPGFGHPDRYVFDVLETVLSAGRTSRFFQRLVQSGLASDADAYDTSLRYPDLMWLDASAQPGHTNAELEKALLDEIDALKANPITDAELARVIRMSEAAYILKNDSVTAQASELGENAMRGDWRYGETYLENLRKVTAADVQRVAKKYLVASNRTVGYFIPARPDDPEGKTVTIDGQTALTTPSDRHFHRVTPDAASPASTAHDVRRGRPESGSTHKAFAVARPEVAGRPAPGARLAVRAGHPASSGLMNKHAVALHRSLGGPSKILAVATGAKSPARPAVKPTRVVLDNGITVIVQENHSNPSVSVTGALLSAGSVFDPKDKPGLSDFTAEQLSRGTKTRSLLDIARMLEDVGASASVSGGDEYVSLSGTAVSKDFAVIMDVLSDELRNPSFPADELEKARAQQLAEIDDQRQDTGVLGEIAFHNALYPAGHPYHQATLDEEEAVTKALTRDDLVAFHAAHYFPDRLVLTIAGDVTPDQVVATVKKYFGDWKKNGSVPPVEIPDTPLPVGAIKTIVIPVPDKAQVDVSYGHPGLLKRSDPDFYADVILNVILGGGLYSRLSNSVRDKMGLVYGIGSDTDATLGQGPFMVGLGANPANVDKAIAEMDRQLKLMREKGATQQEVDDAISYITGSYAVTLSTNAAVARQLLVAEVYGLGTDYIQKRNGYYRAVTLAKVNEAAKKYLHPDVGALVISGTYNGKYSQTGAVK